MFIQLFVTSILLTVTVQSVSINNSKIQSPTAAAILPKQASFDRELLGIASAVEGSGDGGNLDEYVDDEEDDQLSKITATTIKRSTSTSTTTKIPAKKSANSTKLAKLDANEFDEDYKDDLDDNVDYNEMTTRSTSVSLSSTRPSSVVHPQSSIRVLFSFLTRPPIAAGVLAGLAIGILTSVVLLICLVQRFHKRQRSHSSYTTGLLYPNQYGYSKTPQEFYA